MIDSIVVFVALYTTFTGQQFEGRLPSGLGKTLSSQFDFWALLLRQRGPLSWWPPPGPPLCFLPDHLGAPVRTKFKKILLRTTILETVGE